MNTSEGKYPNILTTEGESHVHLYGGTSYRLIKVTILRQPGD